MKNDLPADRRLYVRVRASGPVQASSMIDADRGWRQLSLDVSEGGMQLLSPEPFAVGSQLLCELKAEFASDPIEVVGRVAWVEEVAFQERYDIGVEFVDVDVDVGDAMRRGAAAVAGARRGSRAKQNRTPKQRLHNSGRHSPVPPNRTALPPQIDLLRFGVALPPLISELDSA